MFGLLDLLKALMTCAVDIFGNGAIRGGKSALMSGASKIGWASGGRGGGQGGRRFGGHRMSRKSLGRRGGNRGRIGGYDPKAEVGGQSMGRYVKPKPKNTHGGPGHLYGRSGFRVSGSPLGRTNADNSQPANLGRTPRGFIKY